MDQNTNQPPQSPTAGTTPTTPSPTPDPLSQPASSTPPPTSPTIDPAPKTPDETGHKSPLLIIVIVIMLIIAIIGLLVYIFMKNQSITAVPTQQEQVQVSEPSPTALPSTPPVEGTTEEVEEVQIDEGDDGITELQTDVNKL